MIASLPMYARAETAPAYDRLWTAVRDAMRARGIPAPDGLTPCPDDLLAHWLRPDLALSQTCGFPYRARLHGHVTLIGTPDFAVDGCPPGYYRSLFVVRADDPRSTLGDFDGAAFACNDAMSQSGWAAPQTHAAALGLRLPLRLLTGGHRLSAEAVAEGRADIAALDAVTWRMLARWDPVVARLRILAQTDPTPGLPLIAHGGADAGALFALIADAIAAMPGADRDATGLQGLIAIPERDYLAVPTPRADDRIAQAN